MEDLDRLEELATYIRAHLSADSDRQHPTLCFPLRNFRDEYVAHIRTRNVPPAYVKKLLSYTIDPDKCKGCTLCAKLPGRRNCR